MAEALDALKRLLKGKKEKEEAVEITDLMAEEIVEKMLERYEETLPQGTEEILPTLTPRAIIARSEVPLETHPSPIIRLLGGLYKALKGVVDAITQRLVHLDFMKRLDFDLYAADMRLTAVQYAGIVVTAALITAFIALLLSPILLKSLAGVVAAPFIALFVFFLVFVLGITYPARRAVARGREMEKELPFALRHLAVVIRSGMSLYQAMESIASADYGVLSREFRRTLREISEGRTTEEALERLALRSKSRAMRRVVSQITRALRIGGNLSDAVRRIAEDLTFEQVNRIREFSEKLNLVGVVFMFGGVVLPALLAILNGIGNAPLGTNLLAAFAMPLPTLFAIYFLGIPLFMLLILLFVKRSDPMGG